jgi:hypothetical protein
MSFRGEFIQLRKRATGVEIVDGGAEGVEHDL